MQVTKLLIEREQEKLSCKESQFAHVEQVINPVEKDKMAEIIVKDCIVQAGVRRRWLS